MLPLNFTLETLPLSIMNSSGIFPAFAPLPCFRFRGSPSDFLDTIRETLKTNPGLKSALYDAQESWTGHASQSPLDALQAGYSTPALSTFHAASAALSAPLQRGTPMLANQGPAFSMARVIQGHPVACFKRPKVKLPPKALEFSINCSGATSPESIARAVSRIARAAWEYQAAGGPVTATAHYLYSLRIPRDGVKTAIISLNLPLANISQFATGASVQMYRAFAMPLRDKALAGSPVHGSPLLRWNNPRVHAITGNKHEDEKALALMGVA